MYYLIELFLLSCLVPAFWLAGIVRIKLVVLSV